MDYLRIKELAEKYIQDYVQKSGSKGVVLGVSGGLDSAVGAYLAANALGPANVLGLILPYKTSASKSLDHAEMVIDGAGISSKNIDLTPQIDAYYSGLGEADPVRVGNKVARERMAILYDISKEHGYLVLGTSNKTEWLLGYFTLWGDMAAAFEPMGDLYKTQVKFLARETGVPDRIIEKEPTADLWPGQTDEGELGMSYEEIDPILYLYQEKNKTQEDIVAMGYRQEAVREVVRRMRKSSFKRRLPEVLSLQRFLPALD